MTTLLSVVLIALFYILGKAADIVVVRTKHIAEKFGVRIFFFGLILGFLTSLPELSLGIHAALRNTPDIAIGNLLGGIMVLFGLILGGSLIVERRLATDGKKTTIAPVLAYLILPFLLMTQGALTRVHGIFFIAFYIILLWYLSYRHTERHISSTLSTSKTHYIKNILLILFWLGVLVVASRTIIEITLYLLTQFSVGPFITGLIVFSLGTNLPELIVTFTSWRRHILELSLANLIGSAIANICILGIVIFIHPVMIALTFEYYILLVFFLVLSCALYMFYKNDRLLTRKEGVVLLGIYIAFLIAQILLQ